MYSNYKQAETLTSYYITLCPKNLDQYQPEEIVEIIFLYYWAGDGLEGVP